MSNLIHMHTHTHIYTYKPSATQVVRSGQRFIWSGVSVNLANVSQVYSVFHLCFWSQQTLAGTLRGTCLQIKITDCWQDGGLLNLTRTSQLFMDVSLIKMFLGLIYHLSLILSLTSQPCCLTLTILILRSIFCRDYKRPNSSLPPFSWKYPVLQLLNAPLLLRMKCFQRFFTLNSCLLQLKIMFREFVNWTAKQ